MILKADWWISKAILVFEVALVAWLAIGLIACKEQSEGQAKAADRPTVDVEVIQPGRIEVPRHIRVTGTLFGQEQAMVAAKVPGRVREIARDIGDDAAPGDLLLRLDPTDFILERDERQKALDQTLAEIGLNQMPPSGFELSTLPTVDRARLQAENAAARFERGRQLFEQSPPLISEQDFSDLRTARDVAEADHRVAVLTAEALLAEARTLEAQLRIAEQRLADTEHTVPRGAMLHVEQASAADHQLEYVVTGRMVSIGDLVQVGTPLFRLVDLDPVKLRAAVPERRAAAIRAGQSAAVRIEAYPEPAHGTVTRINPAVNPQTRTFEIEITIPNPERRLNPGAFARAEVEVDPQSGVMVVPIEALNTFAGVTKVLLVQDGKLVDRPVTIGERFASVAEVVAGLSDQDQLVRRPGPSLSGGVPVRATQVAWTPSVHREASPAATSPASQAVLQPASGSRS